MEEEEEEEKPRPGPQLILRTTRHHKEIKSRPTKVTIDILSRPELPPGWTLVIMINFTCLSKDLHTSQIVIVRLIM